MKKIWQFIRKNFLLCSGLFIFVWMLWIAFFGEQLPFVDEDLEELKYLNIDGTLYAPPLEPSNEYWFGTDRDGRDIFSLIVMGAKETLLIVIIVTLLRYLFATVLSFLAHKRIVGTASLIKGLNAFLSYVPTVIIVVMFAVLPPILFSEMRPYWLIIIIAMVEVGRVASTMKDDFDEIAMKEYIISGHAIGVGPVRMLRAYYLPFLYEKLSVYIITDLGKVMFLLGQLGIIDIFISQALVQAEIGMFEIRNESISWPMLLSNAYKDIRGPVWIPFFPALAMTFTILTFNMIAQGIKQVSKKKNVYL